MQPRHTNLIFCICVMYVVLGHFVRSLGTLSLENWNSVTFHFERNETFYLALTVFILGLLNPLMPGGNESL